MDEITEKRLERDVEKLSGVGKQLFATMEGAMAMTSSGFEALKAEHAKLVPVWSGGLMDMPNLMLGFALSRLRSLGAPSDYYIQIIEGAHTTPVWPGAGTERPAWVVVPQGCVSCGAGEPDAMGGADDLAGQCVRVLLFVYSELREVVASDAILNNEMTDGVLSGTRARWPSFVHERTMKILQFQAMLIASMLPPL